MKRRESIDQRAAGAARSRRYLSRGCALLIGPMLGVLFFSYMFDWKLVQPTYFEWLLRLDPATQFIGWHFFRYEPWHLPLGAALDYGIEMASSIVYTDSIPLFAIAF